VTGKGSDFTSYVDILSALADRLGLAGVLPTFTQLRKFGATTFQSLNPDSSLNEQLAEHMSHLPSTNAQYYRSRSRNMSAKLIQRKISQIMGKNKGHI
jgi:uncharacterized protein YcaQ